MVDLHGQPGADDPCDDRVEVRQTRMRFGFLRIVTKGHADGGEHPEQSAQFAHGLLASDLDIGESLVDEGGAGPQDASRPEALAVTAGAHPAPLTTRPPFLRKAGAGAGGV